jgi:hypothetical protein
LKKAALGATIVVLGAAALSFPMTAMSSDQSVCTTARKIAGVALSTTPAYAKRPKMIVLRASLVADGASTSQMRVGRQLMIEAAGLMMGYYAAVTDYRRKAALALMQKNSLNAILKLQASLNSLRQEASQRVVLASNALQAGGCHR